MSGYCNDMSPHILKENPTVKWGSIVELRESGIKCKTCHKSSTWHIVKPTWVANVETFYVYIRKCLLILSETILYRAWCNFFALNIKPIHRACLVLLVSMLCEFWWSFTIIVLIIPQSGAWVVIYSILTVWIVNTPTPPCRHFPQTGSWIARESIQCLAVQ